MSTENTGFKTVLAAAAVAAIVSAGSIGLFIANQPGEPAPVTQAEPATPAPAPAETAFSAGQKKTIETLVREYLIQNPEILIEMTSELERKQAAAEQVSRDKAIAENATALFRDDSGLIAGNPDGDITIVEFSDYNCPYCKRAFNDVTKLLSADDKVRVVFKEFPIFGEQSLGAARVAIAAQKQGKYFDVHAGLLKSSGRSSEASALRIAEKLGLDMEKLKQDMDSQDVKSTITKTRSLAEKLGIQGTPFYLVGDRVVPGAPDNLYEIFVKTVAEVREKGCNAAC